ncbi:unnamed protein product [Mucor hiemalis]
MAEEKEKLKLWIMENIPDFHFFGPKVLNEATFNDSMSYWEQFLERKKMLFKGILRSNVWAYNSTFKKLHKKGHIGTKLAGRHTIAMGIQKKRLEDLLKLYNKEFPHSAEKLSWANIINAEDRFWGVPMHPSAERLMELCVAREETKIVRRELHNLYSSIVAEGEAWVAAKAEMEARPASAVNSGLLFFASKKIEANRKWMERSLIAFGLVEAHPPIPMFDRREERRNSTSIIHFDDDEVLLVEEGELSASDNSDDEDL